MCHAVTCCAFRMCLSAGIPLLESGTNGYQGQVSVHIKGSTECFECTPKPAPKSFPVCTIRNTPEKPIHCVVWAKDLLFPRLFGPSEQTTDLDERSEVPTGEAGAAASVEGAAGTADENDAGQSFFVKSGDENPESYARRVFERVYKFDIERVLRMEDLWRAR